jgi:tetratricopeptide (TPR) repeat protein
LIAIAAQSLAELGDTSGAATKLASLGNLDQVTDALTLNLATKLMDLTPDEVASLLRRAIQVAYCEFERLSARLDLTRHLLGSGDSELALREVDSAITDAADADNRSMLGHALSLRWEITQEDEDFRKARTVLEALDPEQHWETLARLLIDHGDYDDAKSVLAKGLEVGDMVAHLLAVDVHLRLGQTDPARKLLLEMSKGSIQSNLQYPYAYTMGLVALACNDPALKIEAASRLRKVLQETPELEHVKTLLAALERN